MPNLRHHHGPFTISNAQRSGQPRSASYSQSQHPDPANPHTLRPRIMHPPPPPRTHQPFQRSISFSGHGSEPVIPSQRVGVRNNGTGGEARHQKIVLPQRHHSQSHFHHHHAPMTATHSSIPLVSPSSSNQTSPRKRISLPVTAVVSPQQSPDTTPRKRLSFQSKPDSVSPGGETPAVLVREKKQRACANCRRAKLKCIVHAGKTECVRCISRKEKCIFYPRSHDEEWQQTLTTDVYGTTTHLAHVDSALRHLLHHLTARGLVPPFRTDDLPDGLPKYEPPDRDLAVLQGWGAERQRESEEPRRRQKRKGREDDDDEEDYSYTPPSRSTERMVLPGPAGAAVHTGIGIADPAPVDPGQSPTACLPSARVEVMQTPDVISPTTFHPAVDSVTPQQTVAFFPQPVQDVPVQLVVAQDGSTIVSPHGGEPSAMLVAVPPPLGALGVTLAHPALGVIRVDPPEKETPKFDENGDVIFGSADVRTNIIKKSLITPFDARQLVNFFHTNMAPFMFGYRLELGKFPYLSEGPATMTPFILAVLCLLASERVTGLSHEHQKLADHVVDLLQNSPAESWQDFTSSRNDGRLSDEDDILDPELGIGPEEIVGACILASYMGESHNAERSTIAAAAFKWARGWVKVLSGEPRNTIAAQLGIVPEEREANAKEIARIWLLCYIVDGTEALRALDQPPVEDLRDPLSYCLTLVPLSLASDVQLPHQDILLTSRAKLIVLLRKWYYSRAKIDHDQNSPSTPSSDCTPPRAKPTSRELWNHKRLASTTNAQLDWWRENLASHRLPPWETRQIVICYLFARVLVNSNMAVVLDGKGDNAVRQASLALAVDAAVEFLEITAEWSSRELASLPTFDLYILTSVAGFLYDAIRGENGYGRNEGDRDISPTVSPDEVLPLFAALAERLNATASLEGLAFTDTSDSINKLYQDLRAMCE